MIEAIFVQPISRLISKLAFRIMSGTVILRLTSLYSDWIPQTKDNVALSHSWDMFCILAKSRWAKPGIPLHDTLVQNCVWVSSLLTTHKLSPEPWHFPNLGLGSSSGLCAVINFWSSVRFSKVFQTSNGARRQSLIRGLEKAHVT